MSKTWRHTILGLASRAVLGGNTPLFFKGLGWQAHYFFSRCGKSNVISFALRPILMHYKIRSFIGVLLVAGTVWGATTSPLPSFAADTGGPEVINPVVDAGEVKLRTTQAVRPPLDHLETSQRYWLLHSGIDLRVPVGTQVRPLMMGKVTLVKNEKAGYGNYIIVDHDAGYQTLYAHLSKFLVKEGQAVNTDTIIGLSGNTGRSTGPHLHFEIHENGRTINPAPILGLR